MRFSLYDIPVVEIAESNDPLSLAGNYVVSMAEDTLYKISPNGDNPDNVAIIDIYNVLPDKSKTIYVVITADVSANDVNISCRIEGTIIPATNWKPGHPPVRTSSDNREMVLMITNFGNTVNDMACTYILLDSV